MFYPSVARDSAVLYFEGCTLTSSCLIVHLCDVVEKSKILILNFDEVCHDFLQWWIATRHSDDLQDLVKSIFVHLDINLFFLLGRLKSKVSMMHKYEYTRIQLFSIGLLIRLDLLYVLTAFFQDLAWSTAERERKKCNVG